MKNDSQKIIELKICFPIITFAKNKTIFFARNQSEITTCTKQAFKNGFFNNLSIIDSNGLLYEVKYAVKIGTVGIFWGYNIFLNQRLKVELVFDDRPYKIIDLNSFKKSIISTFKISNGHLDTEGDSEIINSSLEKATSHREIISFLCNNFYKTFKN